MKDIPDGQKVEFVDNPYAPDLFADAATGWYFLNGNVRITFEAVRAGHVPMPAPIRRVVVARLVMPLEQVEAMAKGLLEFAEQHRKQAAALPGDPATIQ
jgi:hypothetical protein